MTRLVDELVRRFGIACTNYNCEHLDCALIRAARKYDDSLPGDLYHKPPESRVTLNADDITWKPPQVPKFAELYLGAYSAEEGKLAVKQLVFTIIADLPTGNELGGDQVDELIAAAKALFGPWGHVQPTTHYEPILISEVEIEYAHVYKVSS
jgi:hypothetical protein